MPYPQIYLGATPATLGERRAMRTLALDLRVRLRSQRDLTPIIAIVYLPIEGADIADALIMRPNTLILAKLFTQDQPLDIRHQSWRSYSGMIVQNSEGQTPLAEVSLQRDTLRARLLEAFPRDSALARAAQRMVAAVICAPYLHPDSTIALDIEDHRALRKVLGLDELAGLAVMASSSARLEESALLELTAHLGTRLWHDGNRLLFELAAPRHQLQILAADGNVRSSLPLIEGENTIGRRRTSRPHEHRLTITGDDLISSDHAMLICHEDGRVVLQDISKNGTWMTQPGGPESFVHQSERVVLPGTMLRFGETRARLVAIN
jgi:hypothetical protein